MRTKWYNSLKKATKTITAIFIVVWLKWILILNGSEKSEWGGIGDNSIG